MLNINGKLLKGGFIWGVSKELDLSFTWKRNKWILNI